MKTTATTMAWLATCMVVGCQAHAHEGEHEHAGGTFSVTSPLRKDTEINTEYVAQVRAVQHIELRALERGYVQGISVDEGQLVKKGQKMFQIMPTLYQAKLEKAEAEAEFTGIEYQNTKVLAERDIVSPNELSLAKAKFSKAQAEASLAKAHRSLTEIKAPFDGFMDRFHVRQGSLVDEGDLLTTLSDNSKVWVYFNVTEADYLDYKSRAQTDGPTPVRLVMANGRMFDQTGTVDTIEADFNNETGNIAFRATFPNPNHLLRHGQTGKILMSAPLPNALLIPQKATFEILDKKYVFIVDEHDVVHSREISIVQEMPHLYVVGRGLTEHDTILLEGLRKVNDGAEVHRDYKKPEEVLASLELPAE